MKRAFILIPALALLLALGIRPSAAATQDREPDSPVTAMPPVDDHGAPVTGEDAADAHAAEAGHDEPNPIPPPAAGIITATTTLLVFLGLVVILGKYAWGPIVAGLKAREDKIRADIDAAERARAQADAARRQFDDQLATAESRVRELINQAQADGQQLASRMRAQAQEEAEDIKRRAMKEIEQSQREALEQIRAEAAGLATAVAEKILRREVNKDDQRRLIEESLEEFQTVGAK